MTVECSSGAAEVSLAYVEEQNRRLEEVGARALGPAPVQDHPLPLGSHVVTVQGRSGLCSTPGASDTAYCTVSTDAALGLYLEVLVP